MPGDRTVSFFFYGTLIDEDIRRHVLGPDAAALPYSRGWLPGFTVRYVLRARYPALVRQSGARAHGIVVEGFSPAQAQTLDQYEGDGYRREMRLIRLRQGGQAAALVYLPKTSLRTGARPWHYESWCGADKAQFIRASGVNNPYRRVGGDSRAR